MFLKRIIKEITFLLISLTVSSIFWPILILFSILTFALRYIVQSLLNLIYGHGEYIISNGIDSLFAYDKVSGSSAIIHSILIIKGQPNIVKIRQRYIDNVFKFVETNNNFISSNKIKKCAPLYAQRLQKVFTSKFGFVCWKDASRNFNLNNHVRFLEGSSEANGGNTVMTEDKLLSVISELMDKRIMFNNEQPQWEHLIIPNYQVENSPYEHFACVVRVHHAFADGASFGILIDTVLSDSPVKFAINPLKPFPGSAWWKDAVLYFKAVLFGPLTFLLTLKSSVMDRSALIMSKGYSNKKYLDWSDPIDMNFLKEIRGNSGTSVSAVLLTAITGAIQRFHKKGNLPSSTSSARHGNIPEEINIASMSLMLPYKSRQFQNHFTTFSITCPLGGTVGNKLTTLIKTDMVSRRISYSSEPIFNFFIMRFTGYLPRIIQNALADLAGTPVLFSNVPGATAPFHIFGGEVIDAGAWIPLVKTYGLAVATYSYCDRMRLCISTDSWLLEKKADLKWFLDQVNIELENIAKSCGVELTPRKQCFSTPHFLPSDYYCTASLSHRRTSYPMA